MPFPSKILLFGASGSVGGAVLRYCLAHPQVEEVRVVVRRPLGLSHPKLHETVHADFADYEPIRNVFAGIDACFFCLGISVTQVPDEVAYRRVSIDYPVAAAKTLRASSPSASFHYISGQGTKATSRMMWSRVKGKAERKLMDSVQAVCWRPAIVNAPPSKSAPRLYRAVHPLLQVLRPFPKLFVEGDDLARAMLLVAADGIRGRTIENAEIRAISKRSSS